ncbi:unnamed protein product, partial [Mesorhabditis spiculigera]
MKMSGFQVSDYKKNSFVRIPHRCMEKPWPNCNAVAHVNSTEIDMGRLDLDNLRNIEWECKDGKKYPQLLR